MINLLAALAETDRLLDALQPEAAQSNLTAALATSTMAEAEAVRARLDETVARFFPKRRKQLGSLLLALPAHRTGTRPALPPSGAEPVQAVQRPNRPSESVAPTSARFEEWSRTLSDLCEHHIFQWSTHYREMVARMTDAANGPQRGALLSADSAGNSSIVRLLSEHSKSIFEKGYAFASRRVEDPKLRMEKSTNGLQRFLELPVEAYAERIANATDAQEALELRVVCSEMLAGILLGFASATLGEASGGDILPLFFRTWGHFIAFLRPRALNAVIRAIESGPLRVGMVEHLEPIISGLETFLSGQRGPSYSFPRLGYLHWELRRLEISLSLPSGAGAGRFVEVHAYFDATRLSGRDIEESSRRNVALVSGPLRGDVAAWAEQLPSLRNVLLNTESVEFGSLPSTAAGYLRRSLAERSAIEPLKRSALPNYAEGFPLENPFMGRFFMVPRVSVRDLLRTSETDTGIRLWCSVRRSGKTTACFDLSAQAEATELVSQSCSGTAQFPDGDAFYRLFLAAAGQAHAGTPLPEEFFANAVARCQRTGQPGGRVIFVLDEYETVFDHLKAAMDRVPELRFTLVQPLLGQMVAFSRDNLLIFVGQRPDAHFIIMDQNQLAPYVKMDSFPLFTHQPGAFSSEFAEFVRKVVSERVEIDALFLDAVFEETAGHPYLTVNVLVHFFSWLVAHSLSATRGRLSGAEFRRFSEACLVGRPLATLPFYNFFRGAAEDALSSASRRRVPWLWAVYTVLRAAGLANKISPRLALPEYRALHSRLLRPVATRYGADALLESASAANFLAIDRSSVVARIPLLARIAAYANISEAGS